MAKKKLPNTCNRTIVILVAIIVIQSLLLLVSCPRKKEGFPQKQPLKKNSLSAVKQEKQPTSQARETKKQFVEVQGMQKPETILTPLTASGKIAIVLDDWGYNTNNLKFVKEIREPLTLAILPRRTYSHSVAQAALELGKEAILHLPLEPHQENSKYSLEPDTILTTMSKSQVLKILESDIKSVPGVKGVNNHMGSYATENRPLMKILFLELKKRRLYFLDSFTGKTVGKDLAKEIGIPYARRQVFLDNKNESNYILGQVELLAKIAKQTGCAIGIGHDRQKTLEVLVKAMPELKKRGYRFVYVSELVAQP